jgi:seryl-tRNA synthetase
MLDMKFIRENAGEFDQALCNRGADELSQTVLDLDTKYRLVVTQLQLLQSSRNQVAKDIGSAKAKGEDASDFLLQSAKIKEQIPVLEEEEKVLRAQLDLILESIPNIPNSDVPVGKDEQDNVLVRTVGTPRTFDFTPLPHEDLGEKLGLMDFEGAAKMSGARFVILKGHLAKLERALAQFMLNSHTINFGYTEVSPPLLVKSHALFGTGQLPKFQDDQFQTTSEYYLIPTAEVSLTNTVRESILDEKDLPLRLTAHTPSFRQEAGSAGRDTRGMMRQHQFYKVELVSIVKPEESGAEHERMVSAAEDILKKLGLPYRVMLLCTGDMGFTSSKTYDLEVWVPSQNMYREISSCSNCTDFQARRMNARYRGTQEGEKPTFVHTLNGSGLAVGRTLLAVIENYQQADGSIVVPEALHPYMNGIEVIS